MFRIDVGQQLTFSYQKRYQRVQSNQSLTLFPRIVLRLCVATFCPGVCLLRNVVDSVQFALSLVCTFIAYIRRSFKLLTGTILKGSAYLLAVHFPVGATSMKAIRFFAQLFPSACRSVRQVFPGSSCSISLDLFRYMLAAFVDRFCNLRQAFSGVESCLYGNSVR